LRPGDLLFFGENRKGITHVGICLTSDNFAHASTRRGVIVSSLREGYYAARFRGARRLRE
jgi:cell wall-associated NlpC family hydrolase